MTARLILLIKKLLKTIKVNNDFKDKKLNLNLKGNLNILNKKINFDHIEIDNKYKVTKKDLNYYKVSFEKNLFNENFIKIFDMEKIESFFSDIL